MSEARRTEPPATLGTESSRAVQTVAPGSGRGFVVRAGEYLRVRMDQGKQVGGMAFVNLADPSDGWSDIITTQLNGQSLSRVRDILTGPPRFTHLMTVTHDRLGVNFLQGRCGAAMYEQVYGRSDVSGCHENIIEGFRQVGIGVEHVPYSTFNVFMNVDFKPDGRYLDDRPVAEIGEYVDFRAEIDVAVSISACPYESIVHDDIPTSLTVELFEEGVTT